MTQLEQALARELASWEAAGLRRTLADPGRVPRALEFASNDYLGLASHPALVAAAHMALDAHGAGGRASRLLGGGSPLDERAESAAAEWLGAPSALLFASGYQANLGAVTALAGRGDLIVSDERNHASLIDAARLSRARVTVVGHGDLDEVAAALARSGGARRRIVLTEGVFSMDGDRAPLGELAELCLRHDAWLVVDEAHAAGLVGPRGAGAWSAAEAAGADPARLAARVITGGKALGAAGGLVCGSRELREKLLNRARSFVYTTALPPPVAGALGAALRIAPEERKGAARAMSHARRIARALGLAEPGAAIVPIVAGSSERALALAAALAERGLDVRAVRPPTVPEGTARLRIACHAYNTDEAVERLVAGLRSEAPPAGPIAIARPARALAIVGTDTGVGKTVVGALLLRAALERFGAGGARYWKPVQTGPDSDTETVRALCGAPPEALAAPLHALPLPASPHEAAAAAGVRIELAELRARLAALRAELPGGALIVELAGGLCVPYSERATQADLLAVEGLDTVVVARSGLGTLNHTLLTLEALAARHLRPRALFLVGPPHAANRRTLALLAGLDVHELDVLRPLDAGALAGWCAAHDLGALFAP